MQFSTLLLIGTSLIALVFGYRAWDKVSIEFNARDRVEFGIISVLAASSVVAVLTTVGIVVSLLSETLHFAQMHPISDFLFGTVWSPQFHSGEVEGYGSELGVLPLLWGTLYISFVALAFSVPIGLFAAIYLSLTMAMGAGMTSAITSPLHAEVMQAVRGGDVMMGHDPDCTNWIRAYREPAAEGEGRGGRRSGRAGRRRSA